MARVFLIFTILIGLGAAFLGFKTKQQADELQSTVRVTKDALSSATTKLKKAEGDLKTKEEELTKAQTDLKQKEEDLTKAVADVTAAKADVAKAKSDAMETTTKLAGVQGELDKIKEQFKDINPSEIAAKMAGLNEAKAKLETELAEALQVQKTLQAKAEEAESRVAPLEQQIKGYKDNVTRNGLTGKVLAYNPGWNFVVLSLGDKAGVKSGAQLVVTRGGAMIGKVKVTTVEPSTSIADVLSGTLARGQTVQPGDTVIVEGTR